MIYVLWCADVTQKVAIDNAHSHYDTLDNAIISAKSLGYRYNIIAKARRFPIQTGDAVTQVANSVDGKWYILDETYEDLSSPQIGEQPEFQLRLQELYKKYNIGTELTLEKNETTATFSMKIRFISHDTNQDITLSGDNPIDILAAFEAGLLVGLKLPRKL